jgi:plastocyanin
VVLTRALVALPLALGASLALRPAAPPQAGGGRRADLAAASGSVRGRVELRRSAERYEGRPLVAELGMPVAREPVDRRRSVVYLETVPQAAFDAPAPGRAVLDQRNESFVPPVVAITVGSTVDFPNSDRVYHNVFSLSKTRRFDLGRYPRGQSRSVVFDRPGVVRVFCEIHSHMNAYILVFAHRFFSVTDAEGRYRIDGIPSGSYTLAVWNEGAVRERRELQIEPGQLVEQDLVVE